MTNLIGQSIELIDSINNKLAGATKILKAANDVWVLDNRAGQLNSLLHKNASYKLSIKALADADYNAVPLKLTKDFLVVKVVKHTGGRERRRFIRVTCDIPTIITYQSETNSGKILELAYGSIVVMSKLHMQQNDPAVVRINEMDGETVLTCTVLTTKYQADIDEDDPWFEGFIYVLLVDEQATGEKSMDLLYSKIYRLQNAPQ